VVLYREEDHWIAHCIEMDLVADGLTPTKAIQHLRRIIDFQISSVLLAGNLESLFSRAPSDIIAAFYDAIPWPLTVSPTKYIEFFNIRITSGD
jgi:hypothetical protein